MEDNISNQENCPYCHSLISEEQLFCTKCGMTLKSQRDLIYEKIRIKFNKWFKNISTETGILYNRKLYDSDLKNKIRDKLKFPKKYLVINTLVIIWILITHIVVYLQVIQIDYLESYATFLQEKQLSADMQDAQVYIVQSGDCLMSICRKFNIDYQRSINKIIQMNNIADISKIYPGQELYLPIN